MILDHCPDNFELFLGKPSNKNHFKKDQNEFKIHNAAPIFKNQTINKNSFE